MGMRHRPQIIRSYLKIKESFLVHNQTYSHRNLKASIEVAFGITLTKTTTLLLIIIKRRVQTISSINSLYRINLVRGIDHLS